MKPLLRKFLYLIPVSLLLFTSLDAQQRKATQAAKKKEQVERSYKKAYAKARKRTIKHRRDIQTDNTKRMMNEADKRATTFNKLNDPTFFERYLKRKKLRKR
jgi:hypothetical protein